MKKAWRQAAREAMYEATLEEARQHPNRSESLFNYRWEHVTTVVNLALKLAKIVGADEEVVEAAAWLHDIAKIEGADHPNAGAREATMLLAETNFPPQKVGAVAEAIVDHMGLWREESLTRLESMVLWDADKLSKIGLTAAFHWTGMALAEGRPITMSALIDNGRNADWLAKTVASMHTEPAHQAAEARKVAFEQLWELLEAELSGDDLPG